MNFGKLKPIYKTNDLIGEILDSPSIFSKNAFSNSSTNQSNNFNKQNNKQNNPLNQKSINQSITLKKPIDLTGSDDESGKKISRIENTRFVKEIDRRSSYDNRNEMKKPSFENYVQKSNLIRFNQSSYDIMDIIERKRNLRDPSVAKATRSNLKGIYFNLLISFVQIDHDLYKQ